MWRKLKALPVSSIAKEEEAIRLRPEELLVIFL